MKRKCCQILLNAEWQNNIEGVTPVHPSLNPSAVNLRITPMGAYSFPGFLRGGLFERGTIRGGLKKFSS